MCFTCMGVCARRMPGAYGGQKGVVDLLEQTCRTIVSPGAVVGNGTLVL